ncbi:MAG TPA: MFS transporter [Steroidobacteraceae bacterium]|nr:MFS transporter [Steroidobacteraceae bacterium]
MTTPVRTGWALLAGLTLLNVLNFADRFLLVSFANSIITDLSLTKFQFTLLTGLVFSVFYVVFGLFAGSLADRLNRPRLIAAGLFLWSALTAATGLAKNFLHAGLARVFVGVGEAVLTPAALSMLSDRLPRSRHGIAAAIYYLGIPIGVGSSFIFASLMGPVFGWRGTFMILGGVGVLGALLVLLLKDPPRGGKEGISAETQPIGSFRESLAGLVQAMRASPVLLLTLCGSASAIFVQGASVLEIVWWVQERGFTEVEAQRINGSLFLFGGITGAVLGGLGADAMYKRNRGGRLKFLALAFIVVAPVGLALRFLDPASPLFYVAAFIGAASFMLPYGTTYATVQECVPVNLRGAAIALLNLFSTLIGHAFGAALAGFLADRFAASGMDQPITAAILFTGIPGLLAIPLFWYASQLHAKTKGV